MISRAQLISRFEMFVKGEWTALIRAGEACATQAGDTRRRKRRREGGWLSGSPELKFIWGSCHPLGKLSRVQILHQVMKRH